jgi:hypothetical protein
MGDAAFSLSATSTSGLVVSYSSSNTAVATVSGTTVTIVGAGTTTITANQSGNQNYNAASPVNQVLEVKEAIVKWTFEGVTTTNSNNQIGYNTNPFWIGKQKGTGWPGFFYLWNGKIDDIGMWNRSLTQQEITALYTSCLGNEIISQPTNSINTIGSNAQFSVNSVAGSSYQWQSNPSNFGWQNVPNNANYSGGTTNTLTVSNVQLFNHNQPIRAISTSGNCTDTSNTVTIQVADTCITNVTVYDTLYTTVTDTLIINTTLSLPAPNNENTIMIYPNPASDHITIDNGNYTAMAGYTIKIENNAGQQVFQNAINQAQFYVDLSTWSGNGLYFVHLIDAQGNTVTVRKIVLQ